MPSRSCYLPIGGQTWQEELDYNLLVSSQGRRARSIYFVEPVIFAGEVIHLRYAVGPRHTKPALINGRPAMLTDPSCKRSTGITIQS